MNYRRKRSYLNCEREIYPSLVKEGFPQLESCDLTISEANMVGFNHALRLSHPEDKICHFFIDDYQFERVWNAPERYISVLSKFKAVVVPDFSTYTNFPMVVQQFNHYRNLWLGKYFQTHGVTIIPNISFSNEESWSWVFKGQPKDSLCCLSTVGCFQQLEVRELYLKGVKRAINTLKPSSLLIYGKLHNELNKTLRMIGFDGQIIIGTPQNFKNLEEKSSRNKKEAP